jgi:carbamoyl-phosphate synthase/aspartate carbamoyltransferase
MSSDNQNNARLAIKRTSSALNANGVNGGPAPPASVAFNSENLSVRESNAVLELADGSVYQGFSFGATGKSVAGECVFQTGE